MKSRLFEDFQDAVNLSYEKQVRLLLKVDNRYQELAKREYELGEKYEKILKKLAKEDADMLEDFWGIHDDMEALYNFWVFTIGAMVGCFLCSMVSVADMDSQQKCSFNRKETGRDKT